MSETKPAMNITREPGTLNDAQQRRLIITCKYIDGLLSDIEHALHASESESPFPHYVADINSAQARMIQSHIRRLRAQLLRTLDWQHMKPEPPEIPMSRLVMTSFGFVDIAIEELRPRSMRGCGAVPEDAIGGLNRVVEELRAMVHNMTHSLREELGLNQNPQISEPERLDQEG